MGNRYLDTKKDSLESSILGVWQTAVEEKETRVDGRTKQYKEHRAKLEAARLRREKKNIKEGSKEEYQKFFNAAMKKFKIDSPADLKSDEEKKKFFDYVDKNYTGEKDEEFQKLRKEFFGLEKEGAMKRGKDLDTFKPKPKKEEVELDEATNYEIKNGKIHISKANFRKVHKDYKNSTKGKERMMALDPKSGATTSFEVVFEEVKEYYEMGTDEYRKHTQEITPGQKIENYGQLKMQSMKEALAKVWGLDEAKEENKDLTKMVKDGKTLTGKKVDEVDVEPKVEKKK